MAALSALISATNPATFLGSLSYRGWLGLGLCALLCRLIGAVARLGLQSCRLGLGSQPLCLDLSLLLHCFSLPTSRLGLGFELCRLGLRLCRLALLAPVR